jgi:hypothetical protein
MTATFNRRTRVIGYIATWVVALFATNPTARWWPLIYMFPLGLLQFFYPPSLREGGWGKMAFCFGIYVVHAVFYFRARTKRSTIIWIILLVLILVCNVSGCRTILNTH